MVNVIIYMPNPDLAQELVLQLLLEGLIAHASIDRDNNSFRLVDGVLVRDIYFVITAQTKALLFSELDKLVREKYGEHIPIYSMPITQANASFDLLLRENTRKI